MPWFKVDDGFAFHRKTIRAGNLAVGLWVRAGSWSAQQLTDGHIPTDVVVALGGTTDEAERLVEAELWMATDGGYDFRNWHDFQPSRESVEEEREKARKRKQAWRESRTDPGGHAGRPTGTDSGTSNGTDAETDSGTPASPTRPDPIPSTTTNDGFAEFWSAYPKKVGKPAAEKAWKKAVKDGTDPAELVLVAGQYAERMANTDPKFICHPTTWLNQARYNDEQEPEASPAPRRYPPTEVPDWLDPNDPVAYSKWMTESMR
jgi:hypothetical protein